MRRTLSWLVCAACLLGSGCLDNTPPVIAQSDDASVFEEDASRSSPPADAGDGAIDASAPPDSASLFDSASTPDGD